ncbi:MAG: DUF4426 domain-containing protein [Steroidobacteraceae bacterium]
MADTRQPASWAANNRRGPPGKVRQIGRSGRGSAGRLPRSAIVIAWWLLASCGGSPAAVPPATPFTDPGFAEAGDHRLHYALTLTRDLPSEIAGSYGILQRRNLALLTIALIVRDSNGGARLDAFELEATMVALTGERKTLALTRHDEADGPTWLAPVEVRHRVPVTIEIRARATAESPEISVRLTREFRLD